jgi:galactoside O-acetyltransferase
LPISTSIHPVSPRLRKYKIQRNKQIHIGKNVWLGAGAIILPGVTIGDNSIVGAGSVVTKDVPANVIVVGNPARVLRQITEDDDRFEGGKPIPQAMLDKYQ